MSFASLLNSKCSIETRSVSVNSKTGEKEELWSVSVSDIACRLRTKTASEMFSGKTEYSKSTHILYLKYRSLDAVENRITAGGETYDITGISDMGSDKRYLAVHLEIKK